MNISISKFCGVLILFIYSATQLNAQDVTGSWEGKVLIQGTEIPLVFDVKVDGESYSSTMDSPSQGATGIPMDETIFMDNTLTIKFNQAGIKYVGMLKENTLEGTLVVSKVV